MSHFKQMSAAQVSKLRALEKDLGGKRIVAYESSPRFADITTKQLEMVKMAEKDLNATLVVYPEK